MSGQAAIIVGISAPKENRCYEVQAERRELPLGSRSCARGRFCSEPELFGDRFYCPISRLISYSGILRLSANIGWTDCRLLTLQSAGGAWADLISELAVAKSVIRLIATFDSCG